MMMLNVESDVRLFMRGFLTVSGEDDGMESKDTKYKTIVNGRRRRWRFFETSHTHTFGYVA